MDQENKYFGPIADVMQLSSDLFIIVQENRIFWLNDTALRALKFSEIGEIVGKPISGLFMPPYSDMLESIIEESVEGKTAVSAMLRRSDNTSVDTRLTVTELAADGSKRLLFAGQDLTAQKLAAQAITDQATYLDLILRNAGEAIIIYDVDGTMRWVNPKAEELFGYTGVEMLGRNISILATSDSTAQAAPEAEQPRALASGSLFLGEVSGEAFKGRTKVGEDKYFAVTVTRMLRGTRTQYVALLSDITEQRIAEAKRRQSEQRYAAVVAASSDWFWETGPELTITNIVGNAQGRKWVRPSTFLGPTLADVLAKAEGGENPRKIDPKTILEERRPFRDITIRLQTASGDEIWVRISGAPSYDDDRRFLGYSGSASDITERRKIGTRLEQTQEQLATALDSITEGLAIFDNRDRLILCNKRFARMLGPLGSMAVAGTQFEKIVRKRLAQEKANGSPINDIEAQVGARMQRHNAPGKPFEEKALDGRWMKVSEFRTAAGGYVGVYSEVTAQKAAEASLKRSMALLSAVVDNSPLSIALKDEAGCYVLMSHHYESAKGISKAEALGKTEAELFPGATGRANYSEDIEVINSRTAREVESRSSSGGKSRIEHIIKFPIIDAGGDVIGIGEVRSDVTAVRATEDQMQNSQRLESLGQLAGGIAHDFNNILMIIGGFTQHAIRLLPEDSPARPPLSEVTTATTRAGALTKQMLVFSRRQVAENSVIPVGNSLNALSGLLKPLLGETIELDINSGPSEARIFADEAQFGQVITNMILNARDAMPNGGTISVSSALITADDEFVARHPTAERITYVKIAISDQGVGMDEATLKRIFEPFFTTKEAGKGTGLGLAMAYGFVTRNKGVIAVSSVVDGGTTFELYLPLTSQSADASAAGAVIDRAAAAGKGETVLLAEDEPAVRKLVTATLQELGYKVLVASCGFEALELEGEHEGRIDLLLSDVVMPDLGGFELAASIQKSRPETKILLMSGYPARGLADTRGKGSTYTVLAKPVDFDALARAIRRSLDSPANPDAERNKQASEEAAAA